MPQHLTPREMLARLVAFPTVSTRSNLDLVDFVEDYLGEHGVTAKRIPDATGEKAAIFAAIGPETAGGVVLSGHSDVVPVAGQDWSHDPFTLRERDGRLYGRGACDMKGFVATALALAPEMRAAGLKRPILIAISYDEEIGCLGAPPMIEAMLGALPAPEAVIVGEPTMMKVVTGHKSAWYFDARLRGHEVHSSIMHRGVSAIMTGGRLINWMHETNAANARAADPASPFDPPWATLHAGEIHGGSAHNITARDCVFHCEIRMLPDEDQAGWERRVRAEAARLEAEVKAIHPDARVAIEETGALPACRPETDGAAERLARSLTGDNAINVVAYMTEAGQFQDAGLSTVVCGPGDIAQAHQPDEYITIDQLEAGAAFVRRLIERQSS